MFILLKTHGILHFFLVLFVLSSRIDLFSLLGFPHIGSSFGVIQKMFINGWCCHDNILSNPSRFDYLNRCKKILSLSKFNMSFRMQNILFINWLGIHKFCLYWLRVCVSCATLAFVIWLEFMKFFFFIRK